MKYLSLLLLFIAFSCVKDGKIDSKQLTIELDSILVADQLVRKKLNEAQKLYGWNSPELFKMQTTMHSIDSGNLIKIIEIINLLGGYPGISLVGERAGNATFYVLQHAPDSIQKKYLHLILEAAKNGELNKRKAALYYDRYLMNREQPQVYGSQVRFDSFTDKKTGLKVDTAYVWPIADTVAIDSLRTSIGMNPLEGYLNQFGLSRWQ